MKVVLSIAGSDSSGGAGIQADLKTFEAFGVFGTSVLTVLTAQNTQGVTDIYPVEPNFIKKQLEAIKDDFEINAIKIGMLFSNEVIDVVREFIKDLDIPIVFDPVFISKARSPLLNDDAIKNLKSLLPYATITTPNLFEAKKMFDFQGEILCSDCAVVVKNTNPDDKETSIDKLFINNTVYEFDSKMIDTNNTHGTGCSFSSSIAANLALGKDLKDAIAISKSFIYEAIKNAPNLGAGKGPINHKKGVEQCQLIN
jgi:hydroxymethylpyrimidine/phosphomethylpyrimidine kinase